MAENAVVRARIDERIKNEAAAVLSAMGLTVRGAATGLHARAARTASAAMAAEAVGGDAQDGVRRSH